MNTHPQAGKWVGVSHLIDWRMVVDTHGAIMSGACSNHWIDGPPGLLLTTAKKDRKKERKRPLVHLCQLHHQLWFNYQGFAVLFYNLFVFYYSLSPPPTRHKLADLIHQLSHVTKQNYLTTPAISLGGKYHHTYLLLNGCFSLLPPLSKKKRSN
jgi:hypothetical protein